MSRRKLLRLAIGLALFVPLAIGLAIGYQYSLDNPQKSWFWDYELQSLELVKHFPEPIDYTRSTMMEEDRSFWFYWSPTYSKSLKSYDGGPITIEAGDNPFGEPEVEEVEPVDTFTFSDLWDNLTWWFTDWHPLQWIAERASFLDPSGSAAAAHAGNSYLTMADVDCTGFPNPTAVASDPDCWDDTSGAADDGNDSGFLPDGTDTVFFDAASGAGTATMDTDIVFDSLDTTGFTGSFFIDTFELRIDGIGNLVHAGGEIAIGVTGGILGLDVGGNVTLSGSASITTGDGIDGVVSIGGDVNISSGAHIYFGSGVWTVGGDWTNASTNALWNAGTGSVSFAGNGGTMTFNGTLLGEDEFNDIQFLSLSASQQTFTMATRGLRWGGTLFITDIIAGGTILDKATFTLTGGALSVAGTQPNGLTSTSGSVSVSSVSVSSPTAYIAFGSESWTVSGTWTNASTSSSWDAGTNTVTFDGSTGTLTFAGANLSEAEFNNVSFISAGASQIFTMATRALRWSGTLTVSHPTTTTTLATADFALGNSADTPLLVIGNGGILTANASTVVVSTVTMTGGSSGEITVTTGAWTILGDWDTSGAGSTFTEGSGSVDFAADAGITLLSTDDDFYDLGVSGGTAIPANNITVLNDMTLSGGTYAKGTQTLDLTGVSPAVLTMSGGDLTSTSGDVTIAGDVNISSAASAINFGSEAWTVSGNWTNSTNGTGWSRGTGSMLFDSATGGTMTFGNFGSDEFFNLTFTATGAGAALFIMETNPLQLGSSGAGNVLTIIDGSGGSTELDTGSLDITLGGGFNLGAGGILDSGASTILLSTGGAASWASTSGIFEEDASTVQLSATGTLDGETFWNLISGPNSGTRTPSGNINVLNDMTISGGAYAKGTTTLDIGRDLTMSGGDLTSTSGDVTVDRDVNISSAASAIAFGSESWLINGPWTNASTDGTIWDAGSGTVTFDSTINETMTFAGTNLAEDEFNNVIFNSANALSRTFTMTTRGLRSATLQVIDSGSGNVTSLTTAGLPITVGALTISNWGRINAGASIITVSGNWDSGGSNSVFGEGTSSVILDADSLISPGNSTEFWDLTISAGTTTTDFALTVLNNMIISGTGTFAKGTDTLAVTGSLTMSGGDFTSTSGNVTVGGLVNISSVLSAIDFGSEAWTVSGQWTNASTDSTWDAGTGSMLFDWSAPTTMTFAPSGLGEAEFNNVTFNSTGADQTFTMDTNGIRWLTTLLVTNATSTTTLVTDGLALGAAADTPDLTIAGAGGGILTATTSTVIVFNLSVTTTVAYITSTAGAWTVSGTWSNSSTNASWDFASPIGFDGSASQTIGGSGTQNIFTGTITLTGGAKSFTGNFTTAAVSSTTAARTVTITDTIVWTITGGSAVSGTSGNVLTLTSSTPGTQWDWTVSGGGQITITFADIQDANATSVTEATAARFDATAASNADSENNTYVEFAGSPVTEYIGARWYEDADSYYWAAAINGLTSLTQWDITTDSGYFGTTVTAFDAADDSTASVCSSVAGASLTLSIGGLEASTSYALIRDGLELTKQGTTGGGVFALVVIGAWDTSCSTNSLSLVKQTGGGGFPPPEPPDEDEEEGEEQERPAEVRVVGECNVDSKTLRFTDETVPAGSALLYIWDFGDGSRVVQSTNPSVEHTYLANGTYRIDYAVAMSDGTTYRAQFDATVGECIAVVLSDVIIQIPALIIAAAVALWLVFIFTRSPRIMKWALIVTLVGVSGWTLLLAI